MVDLQTDRKEKQEIAAQHLIKLFVSFYLLTSWEKHQFQSVEQIQPHLTGTLQIFNQLCVTTILAVYEN